MQTSSPFVMDEDADVNSELHGFRKRWAVLSERESVVDVSDTPDFSDLPDVAGTFNNMDLQDIPWGAETFSLDDASETGEADQDDSPQHSAAGPVLQATAKSRPQPSSSSVGYDRPSIKRVADDLASRAVHKRWKDMKQPWQSGPLASLFSEPKNFWQQDDVIHSIGLQDPVRDDSLPAVAPAVSVEKLSLVRQRIRTARMISDEEDFRRVSLDRFKTMILRQLEATKLGKSLVTFAGTVCTNDDLAKIFTDVFAPKATGTIIKRCNAMWRFHHWLQERYGGSPFCQPESIVYEYISQLRVRASPTTPSQFVEAMRFCDALFGFAITSIDEMLTPRVTGSAHVSYMSKRVRKPAEELTLDEMTELERICVEGDSNHIRVIAGHLFFCFMAAARWHDTMYIVDLQMSEEKGLYLIEASTCKHKSSRGKEQQMELLPFTALGQALTNSSWGKSWMESRVREGCQSWTCFLRSWSESRANWSTGRMSTAEATCWLRELLLPKVGKARAESLTVHGLKATLCAWAAKSLSFEPEEQLALGHHMSAQYKSAMIYSRDNQIRLCTKLHFLFKKIQNDLFHPDRPRVARLFELTQQAAVQQEQEDDAGNQTSSDSDLASSCTESEGEEHNIRQRLQLEDVEIGQCRIHSKSKVIHLMSDDLQRFECGRAVSSNHLELSLRNVSSAEAVVCADCSKAHKSK